jgi:hypothetical protein
MPLYCSRPLLFRVREREVDDLLPLDRDTQTAAACPSNDGVRNAERGCQLQ